MISESEFLEGQKVFFVYSLRFFKNFKLKKNTLISDSGEEVIGFCDNFGRCIICPYTYGRECQTVDECRLKSKNPYDMRRHLVSMSKRHSYQLYDLKEIPAYPFERLMGDVRSVYLERKNSVINISDHMNNFK